MRCVFRGMREALSSDVAATEFLCIRLPMLWKCFEGEEAGMSDAHPNGGGGLLLQHASCNTGNVRAHSILTNIPQINIYSQVYMAKYSE